MNGTPKIDRTTTYYPEFQGGAHGAGIPKTAPGETEGYSYPFYVSPEPDAAAALAGETVSALE